MLFRLTQLLEMSLFTEISETDLKKIHCCWNLHFALFAWALCCTFACPKRNSAGAQQPSERQLQKIAHGNQKEHPHEQMCDEIRKPRHVHEACHDVFIHAKLLLGTKSIVFVWIEDCTQINQRTIWVWGWVLHLFVVGIIQSSQRIDVEMFSMLGQLLTCKAWVAYLPWLFDTARINRRFPLANQNCETTPVKRYHLTPATPFFIWSPFVGFSPTIFYLSRSFYFPGESKSTWHFHWGCFQAFVFQQIMKVDPPHVLLNKS